MTASYDKKLIIIIGPSAVGKMTVGQKLAALTGYKLYHNHAAIESVLPVFDYDTPEFKRLVNEFRTRVFEEVVCSNISGVIFTFVWDESCKQQLEKWCKLFKRYGATVLFVELRASLEERLRRNRTYNRLKHKPSKRDVKRSEEVILCEESKQQSIRDYFSSYGPTIRIDNTRLSALTTAHRIIEGFNLSRLDEK